VHIKNSSLHALRYNVKHCVTNFGGALSPSLRIIGYISLLGPPRAIFLHEKAKGTGGELDGLPIWLVVLAEFIIRGAMYLMAIFLLQELVGRHDFYRYQLTYFSATLGLAGILHTMIYFLTLCCGVKHWSLSTMQYTYRLGRNLTYTVPPALVTLLCMLWWQDMNHIPLFQGELVWQISGLAWLVFVLIGFVQAVIAKSIPTGLEEDVNVIVARKQIKA
jgi:hypothetical protein